MRLSVLVRASAVQNDHPAFINQQLLQQPFLRHVHVRYQSLLLDTGVFSRHTTPASNKCRSPKSKKCVPPITTKDETPVNDQILPIKTTKNTKDTNKPKPELQCEVPRPKPSTSNDDINLLRFYKSAPFLRADVPTFKMVCYASPLAPPSTGASINFLLPRHPRYTLHFTLT